MPKVDATALETLSEQIEQLPARTTLTAYEVVKRLAPAICAARGRGQDFKAIGVLLASSGVQLEPATIRNYLWRAAREGAVSMQSAGRALGTRGDIASPSARPIDAAPPSPAASPRESALERARRVGAGSERSGRFDLVQDKDV